MIALVRADISDLTCDTEIDAKRVGIDVGQHRRRPSIGNRIGGRDECQIGNDHLIARLQPKCGEKHQMKASRYAEVLTASAIFDSAVAREVNKFVNIFSDR